MFYIYIFSLIFYYKILKEKKINVNYVDILSLFQIFNIVKHKFSAYAWKWKYVYI